MKFVAVDRAERIAEVATLARAIWPEHYVALIGREQVEYMLANYQSAAAIAAQIAGGSVYSLIELDGRAAGYFAVRPEPADSSMFLSKLYVSSAARGRGLARAALERVEASCRELGLARLWLTVHKRNPSVGIYERLGFSIAGPVVTDIGNGYAMDDYRMQKFL